MAGYICKIVIENTHPPVWRRVVLPSKITFGELHEIIQVLFGWEGYHLHGFEIPSEGIWIGEEEGFEGCSYDERDTLIDPFFINYKWLRYTYDFGDNWQHRINIESMDADYQARSAALLKFKGDNFAEDSGGVWGSDDYERKLFERACVEEALRKMVFEAHDDLEEVVLPKESLEQLKELFQELLALNPEILQSKLAEISDDIYDDASPMAQKIASWKEFQETSDVPLKLVFSTKNQKDLLMELGEKEATDYYKYLRIPRNGILSHEEQVCAVSETLQAHPEYLLYVLDENEYQELLKWLRNTPQTDVSKDAIGSIMIIKALSLGLVDFVRNQDFCELSFASDIKQLIECVDVKTKAKIYKILSKYDDRMGKLIQLYGVIELESLYDIYKKLFEVNLGKEDFLRYIYWHSRFNNFVNTVYQLDGTCYVAAKDLDVQRIIDGLAEYAGDLPYAAFPLREVERKGSDLANRTEWLNVFFGTLHYQFGMDSQDSELWLIEFVTAIMSGDTLEVIIEELREISQQSWSLALSVEIWTVVSGMMLELELPMLKGRNRIAYAAEKKCSPWSVGMVLEEKLSKDKGCHMYQFPAEVQEWMYEASNYNSSDHIKWLWEYKEQNHICSEEYIFLLAAACVASEQTSKANTLIAELNVSSLEGKKAAKALKEQLQKRYEVVEDEDDWMLADSWNQLGYEEVQQPYVRNTPKIGRNDPCPCGSGKKYKKCCGKNI